MTSPDAPDTLAEIEAAGWNIISWGADNHDSIAFTIQKASVDLVLLLMLSVTSLDGRTHYYLELARIQDSHSRQYVLDERVREHALDVREISSILRFGIARASVLADSGPNSLLSMPQELVLDHEDAPMPRRLDSATLRQRYDMYLVNHYATAHMMVVSLALGIGGIAAVTLIQSSPRFHGYQIAFWLLWLASLLATAVAYAGTMIGSLFLPARLPAVSDLLLPLWLGISEFFLFAVLGFQATGLALPISNIFGAWWFALGGFGFLAGASVWRVRFMIKRAECEPDIAKTMDYYRRRLASDGLAATATGVFGVCVGCAHVVYGELPTRVNYVLSVVVVVSLAFGLLSHRRTASVLRTELTIDLSDETWASGNQSVTDRSDRRPRLRR